MSDHEQVFNSSPRKFASVDEKLVHIDIYDPTNWASIELCVRDFFL